MDENPAPPASAAATDTMTGTEQSEPGTSVASTAAASSHEDGEGAAAAAAPSDGSSKTVSEQIASLLWGGKIKPDVFRRWLQGFSFSDCEPSALVQRDGGPCCVIAPVQAYLLKILLAESPAHSFMR
uniref:Ubiquitin carboxyl-terminal hydrolase MINDY n=1 Tax=Anopheles coluzzii TaxID=1518534 RepID=A0A8W7PZ06_ANOCL